MALVWDNLGLNYEGQYGGAGIPPISIGSVTAEHAELTRSFLTYLFNQGFRYFRWGGSDVELFGGGAVDARIAVAKSIGFDTLNGGSWLRGLYGSTLTPAGHKAYSDKFAAIFPAVITQNCTDTYSIANEVEEGIGTRETLNISRTSNIATATFRSAGLTHYYQPGDVVTITGVGSPNSSLNATNTTILSVPNSSSFTYASTGSDASTNPFGGGGYGQINNLLSLTRSGNVVTANFAIDHNYKVGDTVCIASTTPSTFNTTSWSLTTPGAGIAILSVPTSRTFTYASTGVDESATTVGTAQMSIETYMRLQKDLAINLRAIAASMGNTTIKFAHTTTENPVGIWCNYALGAGGITPGVDIDYFGMNTYGAAATDLANFEAKSQQCINAFGSRYWATEMALHFNWNTGLGQVPTVARHEYYMNERVKILRRLGVARVYVFKADQEPRGGGWAGPFEIANYMNNTPRDGFYSLVADRRTHIISGLSSSAVTTDLATPVTALRRLPHVDRGNAVDFNQTTSAVTFTTNNKLDPAKLTRYSVAVRVYVRTMGAGGAGGGRIADLNSAMNPGLFNLFTNPNGAGEFRMESFGFPTNAACGSGAGTINFNTWQTVVATFDLFENFPRIYLDCIDKTSSSNTGSSNRGSTIGTQAAWIGNRFDQTKAFDGLMQDFYIWDRILTRNEMGYYKNGSIPPGYVFGLRMNEATGNLVNATGDGSDGTPLAVTQGATGYSY